MVQMARRAVDDIDGALLPVRFVLHDRDSKFCASFRDTLRSAGIQPLSLPARSPNLNAFAERWVRSIKSECLSKLILFVNYPCAEQSLNSSSIIISNALIKARVISFSSLLPFRHHHNTLAASNAMSDSVDCSSSINAPHEYFDPTATEHSVIEVARYLGALARCCERGRK
jgi:transposase InsO family protein